METESGNIFLENGITALGLFAGIVAGAAIQFVLQYLFLLYNRSKAKKIFKVEIQHNLSVLPGLKKRINSIKTKALARSLGDHDFYIDMSLFNYRASDTLINHGWFHQILSAEHMKDIFRFWTSFNTGMGNQVHQLIRIERDAGNFPHIVEICSHVEDLCEEFEGKLASILREI